MIEVLKTIILEDFEEFTKLFKIFIAHSKNTSYKISEDILSEFFTTNSKLVELLDIIPTTWLKPIKVQETLIQAVESYSIQQRVLQKAKQTQNNEIWNQLNTAYQEKPPQKRINHNDDCCICAKPLIRCSNTYSKRHESIVHFFTCKHRFHTNCLETMSVLSLVNSICPICK